MIAAYRKGLNLCSVDISQEYNMMVCFKECLENRKMCCHMLPPFIVVIFIYVPSNFCNVTSSSDILQATIVVCGYSALSCLVFVYFYSVNFVHKDYYSHRIQYGYWLDSFVCFLIGQIKYTI